MSDVGEILFFLMGAMTIVEIVDAYGGFKFVSDKLKTRSAKALMWRVALVSFFMSALLDNLTTTIVMLMVLSKIVEKRQYRLIYAVCVVLAANSGGAFSPIGDVTTIMLWIRGLISSGSVISHLFLPSLISVIVPLFIMGRWLRVKFREIDSHLEEKQTHVASVLKERMVFYVGVGGLVFVPIFKMLTGLPPFVGVLLVLGILWVITEIHFDRNYATDPHVISILARIDLGTIMFFLGILMTVGALQEVGVLKQVGQFLDEVSNGNVYVVTGAIGVLSSIVDNVPLVASAMGMYDASMGMVYEPDGLFWMLLAYCAGVGGSMLIIGSAAGVVAMGIEKISFVWYMKHISWIVFIGYIAGIFVFMLQEFLLTLL
jgi:Na+/H+ antiporter NhaD/arsenite permease-like protein